MYKIKSGQASMAVYYIICAICITLGLYYFTYTTDTYTKVARDISIFASESLLIMSPLWIIGKRWRWISAVIPAGIMLFLFSNALYFRYWLDLIPFHSIFNTKSYNALVFNSVPGLLQTGDMIYVILAIIPFVAYRVLKVRMIDSVGRATKSAIVLSSLMLYCGVQLINANATAKYKRSIGNCEFTLSDAFAEKFALSSKRAYIWRNCGLIPYFISQSIHISEYSGKKLTPEEREYIGTYIKNHAKHVFHPTIDFSHNRNKNLIMIIVESLNAEVIDKIVNGQELTPVLNKLRNDSTTISCVKVESQVRDGGSSDGQMIYNTGLLPIKNGAAALLFGDNTFPSLAKTLAKKESKEIIAEEGSIWNHKITSKGYGYDELIERVTESWNNQIGHDEAVFKSALNKIRMLEEPFFMEITSLSMHFPYRDEAAITSSHLSEINGISKQHADYYRMTNYFDSQLGKFIDGLKKLGIYDSSVIVIASDHNVRIDDYPVGHDEHIVFMVLNSGIYRQIEHEVGQIDVFPTILEIMGHTDAKWAGLGISMLNPFYASGNNDESAIVSNSENQNTDAWNVSDLIIRSDYFSSAE